MAVNQSNQANQANQANQVQQVNETGTKQVILDAARRCLLAEGYAAMSTRKVASEAGVPLSQVHYHFGSKGGMVLALLAAEDRRRLARQTSMYAEDAPLWKRYEQACDFLEDDLESGYVRILWELWAAGLADEQLAARWRDATAGWRRLMAEVVEEWSREVGFELPISATAVATLVANLFQGLEVEILAGVSEAEAPHLEVLEAVAQLIERIEAGAAR
jgi:AcrR family transcriptional regulator